ncbi:uncharacterized protein LOC111617305 [Centruroides sculpturatus]|uniref:uncharacterized protein LOC111617305 n=1 Tax=Centruroides sculpturatus TaxID=218467 RepID=UPI000C6CBC2F|nr:uncharacterized protein LOC111617305 [Centruroides sculpturatus]
MLKERTRDPLQVAVQKLQKKIDTILELKTPTTPTYAQIATRKVQKPKKEVILVDPESEEDDAERTKQKLKKKINPKKMGIGIQSVRKLRRGGVAIEVATTEEREKLRKAIETKAGLKTKVPSRRKPRVVLYGVATDITKDEITECLYEQNEIIKTNMTAEEFSNNTEVKFQFGNKNKNTTNWVLETTPTIRKLMIQIKKTNLGWTRCGVDDYIAVTQCYQCCKIGHIAKDCTEKGPTCSQCGLDHKFKDCSRRDKTECVNCKREKLKVLNHNACSKQCPLIQRIRKILIDKTDYGE